MRTTQRCIQTKLRISIIPHQKLFQIEGSHAYHQFQMFYLMKINIMNVGGCKPQYTTRLHRRLSFALRSNKCSDL